MNANTKKPNALFDKNETKMQLRKELARIKIQKAGGTYTKSVSLEQACKQLGIK